MQTKLVQTATWQARAQTVCVGVSEQVFSRLDVCNSCMAFTAVILTECLMQTFVCKQIKYPSYTTDTIVILHLDIRIITLPASIIILISDPVVIRERPIKQLTCLHSYSNDG